MKNTKRENAKNKSQLKSSNQLLKQVLDKHTERLPDGFLNISNNHYTAQDDENNILNETQHIYNENGTYFNYFKLILYYNLS